VIDFKREAWENGRRASVATGTKLVREARVSIAPEIRAREKIGG
jgi:hypothetical protein